MSRINTSIETKFHERFKLFLTVTKSPLEIRAAYEKGAAMLMESERDVIAASHPTMLSEIFPAHSKVSKHQDANTQSKTGLPKGGQGKADEGEN